jgi:hypothetical protein
MTMRKVGATKRFPNPSGTDSGGIRIVFRQIVELELDLRNPRTHSPGQVRQIARSIEAFGFNVPVLIDAKRKVIAGHGRIMACKLLGWSEVPTIALEHLSEAQAKAFMIADTNRNRRRDKRQCARDRNRKGLSHDISPSDSYESYE